MSNTMRTDEVNKYLRTRDEYAKTDNQIWVNHACQLERELNAAQKRIQRLEDALTSIGEYWNRHNNERAMEEACWHAVNTAADALEAKEAKL